MFERDLFAGVNSPKGFFSYFPHISDDVSAKQKIYIKGGSGMGKSGFMKKVADKALQKGLGVERFHCSSDASSLDGVNIPELGVSLVDATSPHISDPAFPGAGGEIINFAEFLFKNKTREEKEEEARLVFQKKKAFEQGYRYLKAAKELMSASKTSVLCETIKIADKLLKPTNNKRGRERRLFMSAFCPGGIKNYSDDAFGNVYTVCVSGELAHSTLNMLCNIASERGYDTECFFCPMFPDEQCDHLYIPQLQLTFSAQNAYHVCTGDEVIDLTRYNTFESDCKMVNALIREAISCFETAKGYHMQIEKLNVPFMNFDALNIRCDQIIKSIFN